MKQGKGENIRIEKKANYNNPLTKKDECRLITISDDCIHHDDCTDIESGQVKLLCQKCGRTKIITPKLTFGNYNNRKQIKEEF